MAHRSTGDKVRSAEFSLTVDEATADRVTLRLEGKAETAGKVMFSFELAYAGVFRIVNVPKENLHPLVMIECPRLLFPFARQIIAEAVRNGGFPPLYIDPIDFVGLYRQEAAESQSTGTTATPGQPNPRYVVSGERVSDAHVAIEIR